MVSSVLVNGIDLANLDRSVSPADNFYQFANGGWIEKNPIPAEYSRWGAFEELHEKSMAQLHAILDECVADQATTDPNRQAVRIIYATGMDEDACRTNGLEPLKDVFEAIDHVETGSDVLLLAARMLSEMGVDGGLFAFYNLPDAKNSSWEVIKLSQSNSLGIGDRDFYFLEEKKDIRDKYLSHVARMLRLGGFYVEEETAGIAARSFMELETKMANVCRTRTERRDPEKTYNKFEGPAHLTSATKTEEELPWIEYFRLLGLSDEATKTIIVDTPAFFTHLTKVLTGTKIDVWKTYLRYHVMKDMADYLSPEIKEEEFSFFGTVMTGQPEMKSRWKRVLNTGVTKMLEDSLGILYTARHFTPAAKQACLEMVEILTNVLDKRIESLEWMQPPTKEKAKEKLANFRPMIGYPNKWDVDDVPELLEQISISKSYATNIRACNVRNFRKIIEKIDKPVDPDHWEMPSTMVNAYFHPLKNVVVFPAAILQPPFFYHPTPEAPHGDPAVNFSAIGAVISHEISHGYDDQGRKFDARGELADWWSEEDAAEYDRRAAKMVELCSDYKVFGKNLNGKLCLGENLADYGGVKLSYKGLKLFQEKYGPLPTVDEFTPEQRFFLGWASVWRHNIREESALQRIIMDVHAPGEFRANVVQAIEEFHDAFNVKDGDKMYQSPEARCEIW